MSNVDKQDSNSSIPSIEVPEFDACIPEYLLKNMKQDSNKWLLEQVSRLQQSNQWQNKKIHDIYEYTRKINGQVISLKEFRSNLISQMEAEHRLDKLKEENKRQTLKLYKIICIIFLTVVYPLFLAQWTTGNVSNILKLLW